MTKHLLGQNDFSWGNLRQKNRIKVLTQGYTAGLIRWFCWYTLLNWCSHNFDFVSLKSSSPDQFLVTTNSGVMDHEESQIKSKTDESELAKEKKFIFCNVYFFRRQFFWHFLNIFTYEKTTSYAFLLVCKIVDSL